MQAVSFVSFYFLIYAWRILCSEVIFLKENCCYCLLLRSFLFLTICNPPTLLNLLPVSTNWSSLFISLFIKPESWSMLIPNFPVLGQILTTPEQFKALPGVSYPQDPVQLYSGPGQKFLLIWITIHKRSLQTKFHYSKLKIECSRVVFKFINILILAGFCLQVYS